ncbi:MAG: peptidylprolyl isomerase [Pseudomonadota bacterium]
MSLRVLLPLLLVIALPVGLAAQSQFRTVASVDSDVVTAFEVEQRARFLTFVNAPGASRDLALDQLIDDRLKIAAARRAGIQLTEEGLDRGMADFAGRANLETDAFIARLRAQGIEEGTFREFVRVGLTWREVVRARFGARAEVTDDEIDRAEGAAPSGARIRVLMSEIVLPARPNRPEEVATSERNAERLRQITSISRFQAEARELSVSPSRDRGGRVNWLELSELPPGLGPILLTLSPGEVTQPLRTDNAIILFQLRDIEEREGSPVSPAAIDYAALYLPASDPGAASRIEARVDTCDDLYGVARDMPREALERSALPVAQIPEDVAIELAKLDPGEVSTALRRAGGETLVFLMLCARVPALPTAEGQDGGSGVDRNAIRAELRNRRLNGLADGFLAELRAGAVITVN